MTKIEWQEHNREVGAHDTKACAECAKRRKTRQRNQDARNRSEVYRSMGMVRTPYGWE